MKSLTIVVALTLGLSACSLPVKLAQRDLASVKVIAEKRGEVVVAKCADTLSRLLQDKLDLVSEDADGLLALAFKAYLLKQGNSKLEEAFKQDCGPVVAELVLEVGKALR